MARTVTTVRVGVKKARWVGFLICRSSPRTSDQVCVGVLCCMASLKCWGFAKQCSRKTLGTFAPFVRLLWRANCILGAFEDIALVYWIQVERWWGFTVMDVRCGWMGCERGRVSGVGSSQCVSVVALSSSRTARLDYSPATRVFGCVRRTWSQVVRYVHWTYELVPSFYDIILSISLVSFLSHFVPETRGRCWWHTVDGLLIDYNVCVIYRSTLIKSVRDGC